ncbi:MAG: 16S rRNA (guanine(527)-N(7))-methyltransferase RsmG [Clostridia bacterium]|nr:16S rRNA (guanine(527)-N(7))-methyltransferase RsmG [Clostridia bacterium]
MKEDEIYRLFHEGGIQIGVGLEDQQVGKFMDYMSLLKKWNKKTNLTSIVGDKNLIIKHFFDSLSGCSLIRGEGSLVDIGSGAGFPGMVIGIYYPHMEITLVESIGKKVLFLENTRDKLGLHNVFVVKKRAEEMGRDVKYRGKFDYAAARAVSKLNTLSEYCLPLVKRGGCFLAYKGASVEKEIEESENAINILGGKLKDIMSFQLPFLQEKRNIVKIIKTAESPDKYPRRVGIPKKRPL